MFWYWTRGSACRNMGRGPRSRDKIPEYSDMWVTIFTAIFSRLTTWTVSPATEQGCFLTGGSRIPYIAIYALFLASDSCKSVCTRLAFSKCWKQGFAVVLVLTLAKCLKSSTSMLQMKQGLKLCWPCCTFASEVYEQSLDSACLAVQRWQAHSLTGICIVDL